MLCFSDLNFSARGPTGCPEDCDLFGISGERNAYMEAAWRASGRRLGGHIARHGDAIPRYQSAL